MRAGRKKSTLPTWAHPAIYGAVRTAVAGMHIAGTRPSMRLMRRLGGAFGSASFNRARLDRAKDNLAWCFPEWSSERIELCAVEAYRHLFTLAVELAVAPRMLAVDAYAAHVELGELKDGLRRLLTGRPAVLVTGHCGNWELLGTVLATLGFPMYALYRPLDVKALDRWVLRTRSATGMTLVDKFGGMSAMPRIMGEGGAVGFIADQNAGARGLFVPFFDRLASAYKSIGVMAMHYNAPVICGRARRLTGAFDPETPEQALDALQRADAPLFRYRIDITDVIAPEDWAAQPDSVFYITARYRRAIEQMVRDAPEQYLWMHRYWKSRPRHERQGEPFPDRLREKIAALPWMTDEQLDRIVERSVRDAQGAEAIAGH